MRAAVLTAYGPPEGVQIQELPEPIPRKGEVLVRVHASTVNAGDAELRASNLPWLFRVPLRLWLGVSRPRPGTVLGMEAAGTVARLGEGVTGLSVGDPVLGGVVFGTGGHTELARMAASGLVRKPEGVSFEQAATLPISAIEALGYLRAGGAGPGKTVLIRGASGAIGSFAVQLAARHFGARVIGVCGPEGVERVAALGASEVLDYTQRDFTELGEPVDLMLDVVGRIPVRTCLEAVKPGGCYVRATVPGAWELLAGLWARLRSGKRFVTGDGGGTRADLEQLARMVREGTLEPVIDRRYPLEALADAHRYVDGGHKQGNVVVTVSEHEPVGPGALGGVRDLAGLDEPR